MMFTTYSVAFLVLNSLSLLLNFAQANSVAVKDITTEYSVPILATASSEFFTADIHNLSLQDPDLPQNKQKVLALKLCSLHGYEKLLSYQIDFKDGVIETLQYKNRKSNLVKYTESSIQGWDIWQNGKKIPTSEYLMGRSNCGLFNCEIRRPWLPHAIYSEIVCEGNQGVVDLRRQLNSIKSSDFSDHFDIFVTLFSNAITWVKRYPDKQPLDYVLCHINEVILNSSLNKSEGVTCKDIL